VRTALRGVSRIAGDFCGSIVGAFGCGACFRCLLQRILLGLFDFTLGSRDQRIGAAMHFGSDNLGRLSGRIDRLAHLPLA